MKYRTVVERIGEKVGPIDWDYDFLGHYNRMCGCRDPRSIERSEKAVAILRHLSESDGWQVRNGDYWYDVYDVGMYDGWPFWKPTPAVFVQERVLGGGQWKFFYELDEVRRKAGIPKEGM